MISKPHFEPVPTWYAVHRVHWAHHMGATQCLGLGAIEPLDTHYWAPVMLHMPDRGVVDVFHDCSLPIGESLFSWTRRGKDTWTLRRGPSFTDSMTHSEAGRAMDERIWEFLSPAAVMASQHVGGISFEQVCQQPTMIAILGQWGYYSVSQADWVTISFYCCSRPKDCLSLLLFSSEGFAFFCSMTFLVLVWVDYLSCTKAQQKTST